MALALELDEGNVSPGLSPAGSLSSGGRRGSIITVDTATTTEADTAQLETLTQPVKGIPEEVNIRYIVSTLELDEA
jgi:hypothetical protein